jgi:hypothetical protein
MKGQEMYTILFKSSLVLFAFSLTQDGFYVSGPNPEAWSLGAALLLLGWMGAFFGVFAWWANPVLFGSWLLIHKKKYKSAFFMGAVALLLSLRFLVHDEIIVSERPTYESITSYGLGYWMWISASVTSMAAAAMALARQSSRNASESRVPAL